MFDKGDVIRVSIARKAGFGPEHYGVYDGNGGVYHFTGSDINAVYISYTSLDVFEDGGTAIKDSCVDKAYSSDEIIRRAISKLGSDFGGYNFYNNNCEHFANWCVAGVRKSRQTRHINKKDDKRDIVEKAIDNTFEPLMDFGDKIDRLFGWGDHKRKWF